MDQRTRAIVIGAGALFVLALIAALIFFALRLTRNSQSERNNSNVLSNLPTVAISPSPTLNQSGGSLSGLRSDLKTFIGQGFSLEYPASWGLLTCGNSSNFELDPVNGGDLKNIACDRAIKPITILLANRLNCTGETVTIGDKQVIRSKIKNNGDINYRWCVPLGNIGLDITHRVSQSGSKATSKTDFLPQIEQLIKTIKATPQGS